MLKTVYNFVVVLTKPKMCFNGILKENVPLTVGDWMRYACLAANPLLLALAAVVDVPLYHNWLRP